MKRISKNPKRQKARAIEIAASHNRVPLEVAARYTNSELKEVLKQLSIAAGF
jgi:hypothetical protein